MTWLRNIVTQHANTADICRFIDVIYDSYISDSYKLSFKHTSVIISMELNDDVNFDNRLKNSLKMWSCSQSHSPIICRSNFNIFSKLPERVSFLTENFSHCEIVSSLCKRRGGTFAPQRLDYSLVTNRCKFATVAQSVISCRVFHRFQSLFFIHVRVLVVDFQNFIIKEKTIKKKCSENKTLKQNDLPLSILVHHRSIFTFQINVFIYISRHQKKIWLKDKK